MPIANILGAPHAYDLCAPAALENASDNAPETIVFIHGWLLSRCYWQPLMAELSGHQCLTYDMRGFGESLADACMPSTCVPSDSAVPDNNASSHASSAGTLVDTSCADALGHGLRTIPLPPDKKWYPSESPYTNECFSLAAYAQDLEALLDALKLDQVWLMGHSLGGSVALWAAYLFPDRVKGVICLNAGGGIYIPKEFEKFRQAGQQMVKYRPQWLTKLPVLPRVFTRAMVHKTLALKWGRQRLQDFVCADRDAAEGSLLASTTQEEVLQLPQLMGELTQPVHFITATQDSIMPPRYVNYLASYHPDFEKRCPQGMVSEIADCGHMAMVEQPVAVAKVVRKVLGQEAVTGDGVAHDGLTRGNLANDDLANDDVANDDLASAEAA